MVQELPPTKLQPSRCAICGTFANAQELYPAHFDESSFNPEIFSARRQPDRIHYRFVRCLSCGLVRADPVAEANTLTGLYAQSNFNYDSLIPSLVKTYLRYLNKLTRYNLHNGSLLEIGCGNGFFLKYALASGFSHVRGVEPSHDAIEKAPPEIKPYIINGIMHPGLFPPDSFDAICIFQVVDHILNPQELFKECARVLKPEGLLLSITHNVDGFSAKLLKEKSPIVDIEHTYLFNTRTITQLLSLSGLKVKVVGHAFNTCTIGYLLHLSNLAIPIPSFLKDIEITVPLGNLYVIAKKQK